MTTTLKLDWGDGTISAVRTETETIWDGMP